MKKIALIFALAATLVSSALAQGGPSWRLLTSDVEANSRVQIRLQLVDAVGRPVHKVVRIVAVRVDMSPDNMAAMTAPATAAAVSAGTVVVNTSLSAAGRWKVTLSAVVDSKPVTGSLIVTARQKAAGNAHRILYYRNPMGLGDTSPVPTKDAMGMQYVPVYADEVSKIPGAVRLTAAKIQRAGVRTAIVGRVFLSRTVRATGIVAPDENRQAVITARFGGFVEKLYVSQTGDVVRAGQPLMRVWVETPDVLVREADYVGSLASRAPADAARAASLLRQYGLPRSELDAMARSGLPTRYITIAAPQSGTVMDKPVVQGMHFAAGDTLFKTTDVTEVWVLADVSERDLPAVAPGQKATITFRDDPSESFEGKVLFVYPALDPATRTIRVRIAVANKNGRLRLGQYADVRIDSPVSASPVLAVPASAVLDDGTHQIAFVALAGGLFEPRTLELGARTGDMVQVLTGLRSGERIATSGNFLIDAESNLQTAMQGFGQ